MIFFHIILLSLGNTCSEENEIYLELFNMAVKTLNLGPKSIHTDAMNKKIQTIFMACKKNRLGLNWNPKNTNIKWKKNSNTQNISMVSQITNSLSKCVKPHICKWQIHIFI